MDFRNDVGYESNQLAKQGREQKRDKHDDHHSENGRKRNQNVLTHAVIVGNHGSEEDQEANSVVLSKLSNESKVRINYYCHFHDVEKVATVTAISYSYRFLKLDEEKVFFDDIYSITIID